MVIEINTGTKDISGRYYTGIDPEETLDALQNEMLYSTGGDTDYLWATSSFRSSLTYAKGAVAVLEIPEGDQFFENSVSTNGEEGIKAKKYPKSYINGFYSVKDNADFNRLPRDRRDEHIPVEDGDRIREILLSLDGSAKTTEESEILNQQRII